MRAYELTRAKAVAKISVVSDTVDGKKSVARLSTGLDVSSRDRVGVLTNLGNLPMSGASNDSWKSTKSECDTQRNSLCSSKKRKG